MRMQALLGSAPSPELRELAEDALNLETFSWFLDETGHRGEVRAIAAGDAEVLDQTIAEMNDHHASRN